MNSPGCALIFLTAFQAMCVFSQTDPVAHRAFGGIQPVLSPDGKRIALSLHGSICRLPSEGGTLTRLSRGEGTDTDPAWSPDGKQIAFINSPAFNQGRVRVIAAEDGAPVSLPKQILARGQLQFHPDGKRLLGTFATSGQSGQLQWLELSTGTLTAVNIALLEPHQRASMKWTLSPDGERILMATFQDLPGEQGGNNGPGADLWLLSAAGGQPKKLIRWPSRIYGLCWNGERGVFAVADRGGAHNDLWQFPLDRTLEGARQITFGKADEDWPSIPRNGSFLIHTENYEQATALAAIDLKSGRRQTLQIDRVDFREPTAGIGLSLADAQTGDPVVARVSLRQEDGKFHFPLGALYRFTGGVGHFYARQRATLTVPAGKYTVRAWHGPEYLPFEQKIEVGPDERREIRIEMKRWINMPQRGWFSGENHIHANYGYGAWHNDPGAIRDQCEGENLHVANVMVANSDGDGVFDRQYFLGRPDPLSAAHTIIYWNEEFRSTIWGHMTLGNLSQLVEPIFTGFKDTTNPWDVPTNADIADRTHAQHGTVSYTHPASNPESPYDGAYSGKGLPVDAALGRIDTLDVMGWGYDASLQLWYRLLNCGFRIPGAAGTDVFLNRIQSHPPGWGRCFVKLTNSLTYAAWIRGQKAGHSFVTTGPMLDWDAGGRASGSSIQFNTPGSLRVRARASSQFPMRSLDLIMNGAILKTITPKASEHELALDEEVKIDTSGWLAVRCNSENLSFPEGGRTLAAHGNPIYVEIPGVPFDAKTDAQYFLAWIDRLEGDLKKRDRIPVGLEHVNSQLDTARAVYRRLAGAPSR
jgi:TolB protein